MSVPRGGQPSHPAGRGERWLCDDDAEEEILWRIWKAVDREFVTRVDTTTAQGALDTTDGLVATDGYFARHTTRTVEYLPAGPGQAQGSNRTVHATLAARWKEVEVAASDT